MLTVSLHSSESVFVYLSGTKKEKKSIQQLGMVDLDFSFYTRFLYEEDAREKFTALFKDLLQALNKANEDIYVSIPAEMVYFSLYENIRKNKVQSVVDDDVWLTEQKMGRDFIQQSDCQVKVVYNDDKASLTAVYFPKIVSTLFKKVCEDCDCSLVGIGINLINATNFIEKSLGKKEYYLLNMTDHGYEILKTDNRHVVSYAHFIYEKKGITFLSKAGKIDKEECLMLLDSKYRGKRILDRSVFCMGESRQVSQINALVRKNGLIEKISPIHDNNSYTIGNIKYDQSYDVMFTSALGVLF